ncbi:MAG: DUF1552 domain-containing protein, partial [Myxococcales bacterium]|nr:DUF1552 domain-containing protein [Myxococcales bacterium]
MSKLIPRRAALRGTIFGGAVAIGLPWLEAMMPRRAEAQTTVAPKRILFWFSANGTLPEIWTPNMADLDNHVLHAALGPYKDKLLFLDGVDQKVANVSIGDGHQTGMACLLTNAEILPGTLFCEGSCDAGMEQYVGWGGGISVDQFIANELESQGVLSKFKSLDLGVQVKSSTIWSRLCYSGPDDPKPPREDPDQSFADLFGDLDQDPFELELIRRKRKSVLDAVIADYKDFNKRLGMEDRQRLEKHLTSIEAVEKRLDATGGVGAACEQPNITSPGGAYQDESNYPVTGRAQMELLVMALACDLTRVGSIQWSRSVSNVNFGPWVPQILGEGHHSLSHYGDGDPSAEADILEINKWYTQQFADLLGMMDAIDEGNGTMLD